MQRASLRPDSDMSSLWGTGRGQHMLGFWQQESTSLKERALAWVGVPGCQI